MREAARRLTARPACVLAAMVVLALGASQRAEAATADVTSFDAFRVSPYADRLSFAYNASWSDENRRCWRDLDFYVNSQHYSDISTWTTTQQPVNVTGTENSLPHTEGSGNYYKIRVWVSDLWNPSIVYAEDAMTDGDWY